MRVSGKILLVIILLAKPLPDEAQSAKDTLQIIRWSEMLTDAPFYKQDSLLRLSLEKSLAIKNTNYAVRILHVWSFLKQQQGEVELAKKLALRAVKVGLKDSSSVVLPSLRDAITNLALCYTFVNIADSSLYWVAKGKQYCRNTDDFNYSILLTSEAIAKFGTSRAESWQMIDSALFYAQHTRNYHDDIMAAFNKAGFYQSDGGTSWGKSIEILSSYQDVVDKPDLLRKTFTPQERMLFQYRNPRNTLYAILGLNYLFLFDIENACYYMKNVVQHYKKYNNPYLAYTVSDLAMFQTFLSDTQAAMNTYGILARLVNQQTKDGVIPYPSFYYISGWAAEKRGDMKEAIRFYEDASKQATNYIPNVAIVSLFRLYVATGQLKKAEAIKNSLEFNNSPADAFLNILFQKEFAIYYKQTGKEKLSAWHRLKYYQLKDSLYTAARYYTVKEAESRFNTKEKEKALALAQKETEVQARELDRKNTETIFLISGMVVLVTLSVALFKNYRVKNAQARELALRNDRIETLIKELHHRVKNNMQTISSLLSLQSFKLKDENAKAALREGQTRIEAMALIHQKLYMDSDLRGVNMDEYLTALVSTLAQSYGYETSIVKQEVNLANKNLDVDVAIPLGLIINELVTNSFKYAFHSITNPELQLLLRTTEDKNIELTVRDNGNGLPESAIANSSSGSFGLKLVKTLSNQLNATLTTRNDRGAVFHLVVNLQV